MTVATRQRDTETPAATPTTTTRTATPTRTMVDEPRRTVARTSMMATLSLIFGVAAAMTVLSGVLVRPGIALGLIAALFGIGGAAATRRRNKSGRTDSVLGILLGLAAMVIGVLAATGNSSWLAADSDQVMRVHNWLQAHLPWLV
jgi:drug/metabolite transporter (DMT)-like permease